jgi:Fe-S-cluster-containing hydrogenase component 2
MKLHLPFPRHTQTQFIALNTSACQACWKCVEVCPQGVIGPIGFLGHHSRPHRSRREVQRLQEMRQRLPQRRDPLHLCSAKARMTSA